MEPRRKKLRLSPPEPSKHGLLKLPAELIEMVAEHVEPQDLIRLRYVCKKISAAILRRYAKVHLAERAFLLGSRASLQALLDISKSADLAKHMDHIMLCADGVKELKKYSKKQLARLTLAEQDRLREAHNIQRNLMETDQDLHMLNSALSHLRRQGIRPKISLWLSYDCPKSSTYGSSGSCGQAPLLRSQGDCPHLPGYFTRILYKMAGPESVESLVASPETFRGYCGVLLEALTLSDLQIGELRVGCGSDPMPMDDLARNPVQLANIVGLFATLRHLELTLDSPWREITRTDNAAFAKCFSQATQLQYLALRSCDGTLSLEQDFLNLNFPSLREIELHDCVFDWREMLAYMKRQAAMKKATYTECTFYPRADDEIWHFAGPLGYDLDAKYLAASMGISEVEVNLCELYM